MKPSLTPLCATFVESMNAFDSTRFLTCFSPEAIVQDEGHTHQGHDAIRAWIEKAFAHYRPTLEITDVTSEGNETILSGPVTGTFDGSPLVLHYHLAIADEQITELSIRA